MAVFVKPDNRRVVAGFDAKWQNLFMPPSFPAG
jgi:hypothetical protein